MRLALFAALAVVAFFSSWAGTNSWAGNPAQADAIFKKLLAAEAGKDYDAFVADGTTLLKAALSKTQFEASSDILNARFKSGYETVFLGELNQSGYEVYLYRLRFKDGGDDILGTLSLKDGKVGGIYFH